MKDDKDLGAALPPADPSAAATTEALPNCTQWRPMALKGICECGQRFWKHSRAVREAAIAADPFSLATFDSRRSAAQS